MKLEDAIYIRMNTLPKASDIPVDQVLVHNHVWHTLRMRSGHSGFRGWFQKLTDRLEPCDCGWAGLDHYRIAGLKHWPSPAPPPGTKRP